MSIKFSFGKFKKNKMRESTPTQGNSFIDAKKAWDDRYMNMSKAIRNWQIAFVFAISLAFILALIVWRISAERSIQPVAIEVCGGMPEGFLAVSSTLPEENKIANFAIDQFILNARTIVSDTMAEKTLLNKMYAFSADNTLNFLHDYYQANDPFTLAAEFTREAHVVNSIQLSGNTWQITWDEIKKSVEGGALIDKRRMIATLTYRFGKVNPKFITDNPFGIYITDVSWSEIPNERG